jgi:hypothetical protein
MFEKGKGKEVQRLRLVGAMRDQQDEFDIPALTSLPESRGVVRTQSVQNQYNCAIVAESETALLHSGEEDCLSPEFE